MNVTKTQWLVLGGIVAVVLAALVIVPLYTLKALELPKNLGSLKLQQEIRGDKARSLINKMHGKGVTPKDNMIATYASANGTATVYLSSYDEQKDSEETFQQMVRGIEHGTTPFSDFQRSSIRGHEISFCVGFGQAHYFFVHNESVYWLTTDFAVAEEAAAELIGEIIGNAVSV